MGAKNQYVIALLAGALIGVAGSVLASADRLDVEKIAHITGLKGEWIEDEAVFRLSLPRSDLSVEVAGMRIPPDIGLTSWVAFEKAGESTMMMGDLVMTEGQVSDVLGAALDSGLEVTALTHRFPADSPSIMSMRITGRGGEERLATAVRNVFVAVRTSAGKILVRAPLGPRRGDLTTQRLSEIIGAPGVHGDGVYKLVLGRRVKMHGYEIGSAMGANTWAAFAGTDEQAVVAGDIMTFENELRAVLKALRRANINIVAIHHLMTMEKPRAVFVRYRGVGGAAELAQGLKAALATQRQ